MDVLADIVRPDLALITNVGTAHIGLLGSREAIAREKKRIFSRFDGRQAGFLHEAEPFFDLLRAGVQGRIVRFGPASTAGYEGSETLGLDGTLIHWEGSRIRFPLFGPHNLANALAAISIACEMGIAPADIREGLQSAAPLFGRSQILRGPVTVLVDCYNANPDSMESALSFVEELPWQGRKVAVLGAMRELGTGSDAAHAALARRAASAGLDLVFLFGEELEGHVRDLPGAEAGRVLWFGDASLLGDAVASAVRDGDLVLVKGSRGVALERVVARLPGGAAVAEPAGAGAGQKERHTACC
jgi:UDP-N-acetylmuramoyl-tripeptide--D-alanyl-D-alanine ligase